MNRADELTVLRLIADAITNGDYDSDPEQWKELAKSAREIRYKPCDCTKGRK